MHCLTTVLIASILSGMFIDITYGRYLGDQGYMIQRRNADSMKHHYDVRREWDNMFGCTEIACDLVNIEESGRKKRSITHPTSNLNIATLLVPKEK